MKACCAHKYAPLNRGTCSHMHNVHAGDLTHHKEREQRYYGRGGHADQGHAGDGGRRADRRGGRLRGRGDSREAHDEEATDQLKYLINLVSCIYMHRSILVRI